MDDNMKKQVINTSAWKDIKKDIDEYLRSNPKATTEDIARALSLCGWKKARSDD